MFFIRVALVFFTRQTESSFTSPFRQSGLWAVSDFYVSGASLCCRWMRSGRTTAIYASAVLGTKSEDLVSPIAHPAAATAAQIFDSAAAGPNRLHLS
jgi:hypothetical protein